MINFFKKLSKYKYWIILGIFIIFLIIFSILLCERKALKRSIELSNNNLIALRYENDKNSKYAIAYKYSVEQLESINDSILIDLNNTRKQLKIKDKKLKQLQSIKTEIHIKDSVLIRDTIFKKEFIRLDTLLGNKWYKTKLTLTYPNKINLDLKYESDIQVIASSKKEIIGKPKKCFIGRWFQKKQRVIRVDVLDKNPYSIIKEKKFIIIE